MKTRLLGLSALLLFTAQAQAIPMATVGMVDDFIGSTVLPNSGDATEIAWVAGELGVDPGDLDLVFKNEDDYDAGWELVDGTDNTYAHTLDAQVMWFFIKLGVGQSGADTHYLFRNLSELAYAVVNFTEMLDGQPLDFNFGRISHVGGVNGEKKDVPEPGSLALLAAGLIGAGLVRRRRRI